jgi:transposase InsO family protein
MACRSGVLSGAIWAKASSSGIRKILSWRLSNTMCAGFCIEALQQAITRYVTAETVNTDQCSQFTCQEFIEMS